MMGIYGGNPHIPAENVLCLLRMWVKGTMNLLPGWTRGAVGAGKKSQEVWKGTTPSYGF